jgi:8-oxo-dGTP diphosphatase
MSTRQPKERFKLIPAVYLILRRGEEVLLLQRANTGYQDGKYGLVAGHLEGDELAASGIVREAKEEAGITVDLKDLKLVHVCHRLSRGEPGQERLDLFFEATRWHGEITNMEPHKCGDLSWFSLHDLPSTVIPVVGMVLKAVAGGSAYSEYETEPV